MKKKYLQRRMNTYKRVCPFCNQEFTCHNSRRLWCPDSNCKSMFHNLKYLIRYHRNKGIVQTNERNRNILEAWFDVGKTRVSDVGLKESGFAFDAFIMHTYKEPGQTGNPIYEYLDYGLIDLKDGFFSIVKLENK